MIMLKTWAEHRPKTRKEHRAICETLTSDVDTIGSSGSYNM